MSRLSREATDVRGATRTSILHQLNVRVLDIVLGSWWERWRSFKRALSRGECWDKFPELLLCFWYACATSDPTTRASPVAPKRPDEAMKPPGS